MSPRPFRARPRKPGGCARRYQAVGRSVLGCVGERTGDRAQRALIAADPLSQAGLSAGEGRLDQDLDRRDPDAIEGDDEEASPIPSALLPVERDRRAVGATDVAAPDRLSKEGRANPGVCDGPSCYWNGAAPPCRSEKTYWARRLTRLGLTVRLQ